MTAALFAVTAVRLGAHAALPAFLVVVAGLVAISAVDLELFIVPNRILYPTLFMAAPLLLAAGAIDREWSHVRTAAIGGALGFGLLLVIHLISPAGMGFGDVCLAGLIGMIVGWLSVGEVLVAPFLGFLSAVVVGVLLIAVGAKGRKDKVQQGQWDTGQHRKRSRQGEVPAPAQGRPCCPQGQEGQWGRAHEQGLDQAHYVPAKVPPLAVGFCDEWGRVYAVTPTLTRRVLVPGRLGPSDTCRARGRPGG